MIREISKAAVEHWGIEDQMLMVAEESIELAHAVLKWRRAWKKYLKIRALIIINDFTDDEILENKAHSRNLLKTIKNVQFEAMQVFFMIDQLKIMQPGDYQTILEEILKDATNLLRQRGVKI